MSAIIYTRFSPRRNEEGCESCETQLDVCRAWCDRSGIEVKATFEDRALSGADAERPGLWQAIDSLGRGDVLVVYRLDRLARNVYLSHVVEQAVAKRGASVRSASGEGTWNDAPEDRLIRNVLRALAEYEREVIAARTRVAMRRHQASGRRMSCHCPYGWRPDPHDPKRMVPDEAEQAGLDAIRRLSLTGATGREVVRELRRAGVVCRGERWHPATVQRILRRMGWMVQ
ncbi:MAG TPA: recombinase family protein [Planctomycetota bacterium]|nr:recombinase family protein [Planctomycetota bacterium]HRT97620.1 recombinase family protein [Planctomycetota bacterium]